MLKEVGDMVVLSLSQTETEEELANMEQLLEVLISNIRYNCKDEAQAEQDVKELTRTFEVAMTAMKMIWLNYEGENIRYE